jgi:hypothetical protein
VVNALSSIFGHGEPTPPWLPDPETCPHERLLARYANRSAQLEGHPMGYKCQRCWAEFLPADPVAQRFRAGQGIAAAAAAE